MYITSYKYDFERMLHLNISHENVCYLNSKYTVVRAGVGYLRDLWSFRDSAISGLYFLVISGLWVGQFGTVTLVNSGLWVGQFGTVTLVNSGLRVGQFGTVTWSI